MVFIKFYLPNISRILRRHTNGVEASIKNPIAKRKSPILKFSLYETGIISKGSKTWCNKINFLDFINCLTIWQLGIGLLTAP